MGAPTGPPDLGSRERARWEVGQYLRRLATALELLPDAVSAPNENAVERILAFLYEPDERMPAAAQRPEGLPGRRAVTGWFCGATVPNTIAGQRAFVALAADLRYQVIIRGGSPAREPGDDLGRMLKLGDARNRGSACASEGFETPSSSPLDMTAESFQSQKPSRIQQSTGTDNLQISDVSNSTISIQIVANSRTNGSLTDERRSETALGNLAVALTTLTDLLSRAGRIPEAIDAAAEAVEVCRKLVGDADDSIEQ